MAGVTGLVRIFKKTQQRGIICRSTLLVVFLSVTSHKSWGRRRGRSAAQARAGARILKMRRPRTAPAPNRAAAAVSPPFFVRTH